MNHIIWLNTFGRTVLIGRFATYTPFLTGLPPHWLNFLVLFSITEPQRLWQWQTLYFCNRHFHNMANTYLWNVSTDAMYRSRSTRTFALKHNFIELWVTGCDIQIKLDTNAKFSRLLCYNFAVTLIKSIKRWTPEVREIQGDHWSSPQNLLRYW